MRRIFAATLFVLALLVSAPIASAQVPWFKCYASSGSAYGYGWSTRPGAASAIALRECAIRTPYWDACHVRWCVRER